MDKAFELNGNIEETHAFIQWKGTDVCMDFWCNCGAQCHFDGYGAYCVRCPHCKTIWQMPSHLFPRKADDQTYPGHVDSANELEPDEDHCDEIVGKDGVTRFVARPIDARR
jgi:hypothetical protein